MRQCDEYAKRISTKHLQCTTGIAYSSAMSSSNALADCVIAGSMLLELKFDDAEPGSFSGYASVFGNVDKGKDVCMKGCFADSIKSAGQGDNPKSPLMLWQHDTKEPIGEWKSLQEDDRGLFVTGQLWVGKGIPRADQAHAMLKSGLGGLSIGYTVQTSKYDEKKSVRALHAISPKEISIVSMPMNEKAKVTSVKALHHSASDLHTSPTAKKAAGYASELSDHANSLTDGAMAANDFNTVHDAAMAHKLASEAHQALGWVASGPAAALHHQQSSFHSSTGYKLQDRMKALGDITGCKMFNEPAVELKTMVEQLSGLIKPAKDKARDTKGTFKSIDAWMRSGGKNESIKI